MGKCNNAKLRTSTFRTSPEEPSEVQPISHQHSASCTHVRQRVSLDINLSTKYVYVRKHGHTSRMKKPRKSCYPNVIKIRCASVCEICPFSIKIKISGCPRVELWDQVLQM